MQAQPVSIELVVFLVLIAAMFGVGLYALVVKFLTFRDTRKVGKIKAAILEHFQKNGVKVGVSCVPLGKPDHFVAFVESEPMKRFRLSHIIEMMLRQHVYKTSGLKLDKIYWRFPIKDAGKDLERDHDKDERDQEDEKDKDQYINEGLINYRDLPKADVSEIPWEQFQEAATTNTGAPEKEKSSSG